MQRIKVSYEYRIYSCACVWFSILHIFHSLHKFQFFNRESGQWSEPVISNSLKDKTMNNINCTPDTIIRFQVAYAHNYHHLRYLIFHPWRCRTLVRFIYLHSFFHWEMKKRIGIGFVKWSIYISWERFIRQTNKQISKQKKNHLSNPLRFIRKMHKYK